MKKDSSLNLKTLMAFGLLMILANTQIIRNLQYTEPNCNAYNEDGSCDRCSFRYWKTSACKCKQV